MSVTVNSSLAAFFSLFNGAAIDEKSFRTLQYALHSPRNNRSWVSVLCGDICCTEWIVFYAMDNSFLFTICHRYSIKSCMEKHFFSLIVNTAFGSKERTRGCANFLRHCSRTQ